MLVLQAGGRAGQGGSGGRGAAGSRSRVPLIYSPWSRNNGRRKSWIEQWAGRKSRSSQLSPPVNFMAGGCHWCGKPGLPDIQ